jgi:hypothetical protein
MTINLAEIEARMKREDEAPWLAATGWDEPLSALLAWVREAVLLFQDQDVGGVGTARWHQQRRELLSRLEDSR